MIPMKNQACILLRAIIIKLIFSSKAIFIDMHTNIVKKKTNKMLVEYPQIQLLPMLCPDTASTLVCIKACLLL